MWIDSKEHRDELLKKFHQTVKIKAGLINDENMISEVIKPLESYLQKQYLN